MMDAIMSALANIAAWFLCRGHNWYQGQFTPWNRWERHCLDCGREETWTYDPAVRKKHFWVLTKVGR
jgi:hypothetical protein